MAPSRLALLPSGLPVVAPALTSSPYPLRPRSAPPPAALRAASSHQSVAEANETSRRPAPAPASILFAGACAAAFALSSTPQLGAAFAAEGAAAYSTTIFQRSCAGCHAGGGNILQPNATLFSKDLDRNGMSNVDDVFQITYFGKGRMPGYGEKCTPRGQCTFGPRLSDADIRALAEFVRVQADQGWPN